jgi:CDP-2,3-bis-(O-geranylgeranyl)-sn-glycerol synthase
MSPDPIATALFLVVSFVLTGCAQTAWLRSAVSRKLAIPLDFGKSFRGKRIFGDHKTLRGFVVMVPAASLAFGAVHPLVPGLWTLTDVQYFALGALAGFGFMAGELPNSFLKRQLGIAPGESRTFSIVFDRIDSILGMLLVVSLAVPMPWETWALVLAVGPFLHLLFSGALFLLGVKTRWA